MVLNFSNPWKTSNTATDSQVSLTCTVYLINPDLYARTKVESVTLPHPDLVFYNI